jgi:3-oxoacyl-[acyl-carrier protein] reductase
MTGDNEPKVCLVTGASRGIGRGIALELAELGYTVVGTATTEGGVATYEALLAENKGKGRGVVLDVTKPEMVQEVVAGVARDLGAITVLINNAGITRDNLLLRMKDAEWDECIDANLRSVFTVSKCCLRGMTKARYGRIINISSVVGATGNAGQSNYAATKAGIIGFTKSLALEVASRSITVNAVAPGFIQTDMTAELTEEQKNRLLQAIPQGRLGQPSDVAKAVGFLASDAASYITGQVLHVNGGMHMSS